MTVDEIKDTLTMPELAERYGLRIGRGGMVSCPWHGDDRHASMKIYKDSFHCFACGASGDIFSFVMRMESCDFKTAFISLGGTYEHHNNETERYASRSRIKVERDQKRVENTQYEVGGRVWKELTGTIEWCEIVKKYFTPFSLRWCAAVDALPELYHIYEEVFCKKDGDYRTDGIYILTRCKEIGEKLFYGN